MRSRSACHEHGTGDLRRVLHGGVPRDDRSFLVVDEEAAVTKREKALELMAAGVSNAQAAREVGVSASAVWKWANPEKAAEMQREDNARRAQVKREWDQEPSNVTCSACEEPLTNRQATHGIRQHADCYAEVRAFQKQWRREEIFELWDRGLTSGQIAIKLGSTRTAINNEVMRMRREGWDLPYRRRPAGELVR